MVLEALDKLIKAAHASHVFEFFRAPIENDATDLNRCLKEIGEKRDKALAKRAQFKPCKIYLTSWSEDDRYADDKFYQQKLRECYDRNSRLRRAMGLP